MTAGLWIVASVGLLAAPPGIDPETGRRSYSQHAFTRIRPGSMLHGEAGKDTVPTVDLRGPLERHRDAEVVKHYARLAELDLLADVVERAHDVALAERVEEVRRKETQRFFATMRAQRDHVIHLLQQALP